MLTPYTATGTKTGTAPENGQPSEFAPGGAAMKVTGHQTRSVFDRYDITGEEDLAEASRKLQALAGTISGTTAISDAEALRESLAKSVKAKR